MATIKETKYGKQVEGIITIKISADLPKDCTEISNEDAMDLLSQELDYLSGSNDGSELLANGEIIPL